MRDRLRLLLDEAPGAVRRWLYGTAAALASLTRSHLWDVTALAGAGCVVTGAALIYTPAAWLAAGGFLILAAYLGAKWAS